MPSRPSEQDARQGIRCDDARVVPLVCHRVKLAVKYPRQRGQWGSRVEIQPGSRRRRQGARVALHGAKDAASEIGGRQVQDCSGVSYRFYPVFCGVRNIHRVSLPHSIKDRS
jgi:hypothetical protein